MCLFRLHSVWKSTDRSFKCCDNFSSFNRILTHLYRFTHASPFLVMRILVQPYLTDFSLRCTTDHFLKLFIFSGVISWYFLCCDYLRHHVSWHNRRRHEYLRTTSVYSIAFVNKWWKKAWNETKEVNSHTLLVSSKMNREYKQAKFRSCFSRRQLYNTWWRFVATTSIFLTMKREWAKNTASLYLPIWCGRIWKNI